MESQRLPQLGLTAPVDSTQHLLEGESELGAEHRVDDRVEGGVEVAEPEEERGQGVSYLAGWAQRHQERHDEEREPADHEGPRDDGQRLRRFPLPLGLDRLPLGVPLPASHSHRGVVGDREGCCGRFRFVLARRTFR